MYPAWRHIPPELSAPRRRRRLTQQCPSSEEANTPTQHSPHTAYLLFHCHIPDTPQLSVFLFQRRSQRESLLHGRGVAAAFQVAATSQPRQQCEASAHNANSMPRLRPPLAPKPQWDDPVTFGDGNVSLDKLFATLRRYSDIAGLGLSLLPLPRVHTHAHWPAISDTTHNHGALWSDLNLNCAAEAGGSLPGPTAPDVGVETRSESPQSSFNSKLGLQKRWSRAPSRRAWWRMYGGSTLRVVTKL